MLLSALSVIAIACVHLFAGRISSMNSLPRRKWLSFAGGVSIAFVFVHILPELHRFQNEMRSRDLLSGFLENELYTFAMAGILLFYGAEHLIIYFQRRNGTRKNLADRTIFRAHLAIFALFNFVIGYYLHYELDVEGVSSMLTVTAIGFHFLVNDDALLRHHKQFYHDTGRWIMASAVIAGWGLGAVANIPDHLSNIFFALVTGAIIVNSLKEELPREKESNIRFFLFGALLYTLLFIL